MKPDGQTGGGLRWPARLAWFVLLWLGGVLALGAVAVLLRLAIAAVGR